MPRLVKEVLSLASCAGFVSVMWYAAMMITPA